MEKIEKTKTILSILEKLPPEQSRLQIVLGQGLARLKTLDFIIQKATELGISVFVPVLTARSLPLNAEGRERRLERWKRIAREAAKQSKHSFVPEIESVQGLADFASGRKDARRIFLSEHGGRLLKDLLVMPGGQNNPPPSSLVVLVGPEGGWTEKEEKELVKQGYEAVSLGRSVLKTETAALAAIAIIAHFWIC